MQWSRQISEPRRANRYFENKRVLRGFKTPVKYLLFFQESKATKKKTSWQSVSGSFKFLRANSIHRCFCIILFAYLYIFKTRKVVQWHADRQVTKRTWVRSQVPHPFNIIFLIMLVCIPSVRMHHTSTLLCHPRVHPIQIKGIDSKSTLCSSQCIIQDSKSPTRPMLNGPMFLGQHLLNLD